MATSIGPKIGIDGEKEFRDALQNIIQQCKTLASEVEKVSTSYKKNADALKSNKEQQKALTEQIEAQKQRIETLKQGYEAAANKLGDNATKTLSWKEALNKAETQLDELKTSLTNVNLELAKGDVDTASKKMGLLSAEYEKASVKVSGLKGALEQNKQQHQILGAEIDQQKEKIKALQTVLEQSKTAFGENSDEVIEWKTQIAQAETELKNLNNQMKELPDSLGIIGSKMQDIGGKITSVGTGMTATVTAPLVALGTKAVTTYGDVDKVFQQVKATIGDTSSEEDFENLWNTMMDEATESVYDVQDAADALLNYAQAGFSANQAADMLHGAFALAAGTGTDMTTVTAGMSVALKAFNADSAEASHYADVFAQGQAQARVTTTDLMDSLSYAAPVFNSLNYSVEDLVASVGMMGDAGYTGSEAGAALRTGLMRLAAPTDKASALMEQLGLEASDVSEMFSEEEGSLEDCAATMEQFGLSSQTIFDAEGNIRPMVEIIENLGTAFDGLTQKEKMEALDKIFGKNRGAAWLSMIEQGSDKFADLKGQLVDCEGRADDMADALMSGVGGALERMSSDIDVFMNTLGERLGPLAQKIADGVSGVVSWFLSLDEETQTMIATAGVVVAAIGPVLLILGALVTSIGKVLVAVEAISKFKTLLAAGDAAAKSTMAIVKAVSGIGLIIAGVIASVSSFVSMWTNGFSLIKEAIMVVGIALTAIGAIILGAPIAITAAIAGIVAAVATAVILIKDNWSTICEWFKTTFTAIGDFFVGVWNGIVEFFGGIWNGIVGVVTGVVDSIKQKWAQLQSDIDVLLVTIGGIISTAWTAIKDTLAPILQPIIDVIKAAWDTISNLISAVMYFIQSIIESIWMIIYAIVEGVLYQLQKVFTAVWNAISSVIQTVMTAIQSVITTVWTAISTFLNTVFTAIKTAVATAWNAIKTVITTVVNAIKTVVTTVFNAVKSVITTVMNAVYNFINPIWQRISSVFTNVINNIKSTVSNGFNTVKRSIQNIVDGIWNTLSGFLSMAFNWGRHLVDNIADGIRHAADNVKNAASGIAQSISSFLHFTEPDVGPLSKMHTWMPDMMQNLADGMLNNRFVVSNAAMTVAGDIAGGIQPTAMSNTTNMGGITIVVNGAEGQDVNELANIVMDKINTQFVRTRVAYG